ncbi:hypothetical protein [Streptomyces sp. NPDC096032]|uniref:hypothetical protein n=1 Tax=Streptomyces sp. NPDC096032 TaxID=3366070 RepID=UPI0038067447
MQFSAAFSSDGKAFEVLEQGESLLHDVAELARADRSLWSYGSGVLTGLQLCHPSVSVAVQVLLDGHNVLHPDAHGPTVQSITGAGIAAIDEGNAT